MDPEQLDDLARHADAVLAAQTPDQSLQAAIAAQRPDLHAALATNPHAYPALLAWLDSTGNPAVHAALAGRAPEVQQPTTPLGAGAPSEGGSATAGPAEAPSTAEAPTPALSDAEPTTVVPTAAAATTAEVPTPAPSDAEPTTVVPPTALPPTAPRRTSVLPGSPTPAPAPYAMQDAGATTYPAAASRPSRRPALIAALCLVLVLAGLGTWYVASRPHGDGASADVDASASPTTSAQDGAALAEASEAYASASPTGAGADGITACDQDPTLTIDPDAAPETGRDALQLVVQIEPACSQGDVLNGPNTIITIDGPSSVDGTGPADAVVAVGSFDLSSDPVVVPAGGTSVTLLFVAGQYFRAASDVDVATLTAGAYIDRTPSATALPSDAADLTSSLSSSPTLDGTAEDRAAQAALVWQVAHDDATVRSSFDGRWVPQLSSKKPGLQVAGVTYDAVSTMEDFLASKATYPEALLISSDDWPVFDAGGHWWVTIAGTGYGSGEEANAWCDAQGIGTDNCLAKLIDSSGSPSGSTLAR